MVGKKLAKILKNAQFYSEKWPRKTATKTWLFLLYFWSLLSQFLCLFHLVSPYFLFFHAILEPQNSPPSEVTGIYIYIYVCVCAHMRRAPQLVGNFEALRCIEAEENKSEKGKTRKEKNKLTATQKVAVNFGCFYYKTWENDIFD